MSLILTHWYTVNANNRVVSNFDYSFRDARNISNNAVVKLYFTIMVETSGIL